jgi:hypothetical protein
MALGHLACDRILGMPEETKEGEEKYQFAIFQDYRGLWRWNLVDHTGQRIAQAKYGHAAFAGAFGDAEFERKERNLDAAIHDERGSVISPGLPNR